VRALVSVISAFAVFVHAAVGCCAHHVHADFRPAHCADHADAIDGAECADHADAGWGLDCGEHIPAGVRKDAGRPGPWGGECGGARCLVIQGAKPAASDGAGSVLVTFFAAPEVELTGQDSVPGSWLLGHSFAPPVRRHLAHCVLLI
jgi:hypothetical protein